MKSGLRMVLMSKDRRYDPTPQRIGYDDGERYEDEYGRRVSAQSCALASASFLPRLPGVLE